MIIRPNILLIMTDQQRGDCLSIEGHPVLLTPNMDSIAAQGVRFDRCYSTCPVCIPARRSLLSGQYPDTHGIVGYYQQAEWDASISLPTALKNAGYHTYLVGRDMHQFPQNKRYGYDHTVSYPDYCEWLNSRLSYITYEPSGHYYASGVMHNNRTARPWPHDESLHYTNWTVNEAQRFIQNRDPSCPYFLTVSFLAPHPPLIPPEFYMERYMRTGVPEPVIGEWAKAPVAGGKGSPVDSAEVCLSGEELLSCRSAYYGLINHIDDQLSRLLSSVEAEGADNTIIIFTSDHGEMLGDHYLFRKSVPYEPSVRVPLFISAPPRYGIRKGQVISKPVSLEDIMPTILDLSGVEIPNTVEGSSLAPLMREEEVSWRSYVHIEHGEGTVNFQPHHTLTDGIEKYIWFVRSGEEQFFDLRTDPQECRNVFDSEHYRDAVAGWRRKLIAKLRDRPERFTDGETLISGRPYPTYIERHN
ncbi:arylsulfatase A-like enzyme [Paenibacillus baekrokdamisoli]|uniref:arylsulfatase n=1 Tax=Paenibacillus baekrokdamisoli TaxID=1712516 RepID=UPI000F7B4A1B|nr:arylsulfatase [Paenibacillus baekrokdamisoli]MBB3073247.1 arylsulfatase A-like enzyme [Paenibacillus baekrokdamisoli]